MRTPLALVLCLSACSAAPPPLDLPPPANGLQIATDLYTLAPAEEKYFCWTQRIDQATAVVKVEAAPGELVHHMAVFSTLAPEPEGFSPCSPQIKQTWLPLYGGGPRTRGIDLPAGAGFKFEAGQQVLVQLHLVNATATERSERSGLNLHYAADPAGVTPAGIFAVGNLSFTIPIAAAGHPVVGDCAAPKDMDVFALFPHMHQRGRSITLEHGASQAGATMIHRIDPWDFGDQPMELRTLRVNKGDFLRTTCRFDNPDGKEVRYGESTADEMCFVVLFHTPFNGLGGCID